VLHVVKGQWIMMSPIAMRQGTARCLVKDSGHPYLPVFVELKQRPRGWGVVRFEGQCPCCFGVGVNDGEICPLCFGDGWGLR